MTRPAIVLLATLLVLPLAPTSTVAQADGPSGTDTSTSSVRLEDARAVPGTVWYQGFLADIDTGDPINDNDVDIVAELFDAAWDGTSVWGPEIHAGMDVVEGWFNIELGATESPLPDFATPPYYLQLTINGEAFGTRMKLASAPTAIRAGETDGGGGGGIGGGGDAGYIPVFTTGSEISNSVMLQTSGRISIDSSTSDAKLRVESAGGLPPVKIVNTYSGNVPSMLHIERTQQVPYADHFIYMRAPDMAQSYDFIQCDVGTDKAIETNFYVTCEGSMYARSITASSDNTYPVYATVEAGNTASTAVMGTYGGTDTYGSGVMGIAYSTSDQGIGGDFKGSLGGVSGYVAGGGTDQYTAVYGWATGTSGGETYGVFATASGGTTGYGIYATSWGADNTDWAGYFNGNVHSTGTITSAKSGFEIDHPDDPENAYLRHAYVASPEMKTVTDGTTVLDATGSATVTLPEWFEALNSEVRYQLTAIGGAAPSLHIESELSGGAFTIAGGEPGMKVCWLVTGVRKDRAATADPLTVEAAKPFAERGKYVSPAAFGATKGMGIGHREIERPTLER